MKQQVKSTKKVVKVNELIAKEPSVPSTQFQQWSAPKMTKNDLVIPKMRLAQATSEAVQQKKAQPGEIRESLNNTLLLSGPDKLEAIPFFVLKKWHVHKLVQQKNGSIKKEYLATIPIQDNPLVEGFNDELLWKDKQKDENGVLIDISRTRTYDVFFILPKLGRDIPYVMSFSSTNTKAAQNIMTQMNINLEAGKTPAANCFDFTIGTKSNADNTWYVTDAVLGREATFEEQDQAYKWYKRLNTEKLNIHDDGEPV